MPNFAISFREKSSRSLSSDNDRMFGNTWLLLFSAVSAVCVRRSAAFTTATLCAQPCRAPQSSSSACFGSDMQAASDNNDLILIREFLQQYYPAFYTILDMNEEVWKAIGDTEEGNEVGFTVFAPTEEAFQALGAEKQNQLLDERNLETTQKIAAYHVIGEPVTAEALFNAGGVLTVGGEVPIERTVTGGFFGVGGQEDGGVTLNSAKVLRTANVGSGLVHEVDNLINPGIMWRYMDQLRIPGST